MQEVKKYMHCSVGVGVENSRLRAFSRVNDKINIFLSSRPRERFDQTLDKIAYRKEFLMQRKLLVIGPVKFMQVGDKLVHAVCSFWVSVKRRVSYDSSAGSPVVALLAAHTGIITPINSSVGSTMPFLPFHLAPLCNI
jgi:hypothetical protein